MQNSRKSIPQKLRVRTMASIAIGNTYALAAGWRDLLRPFSPKSIAERLGASPRTVDNWRDGENGPTWKHAVAMLNDDELCALLLEAAGRKDLAQQQKILAARKKLAELEGK